MKMILKLFIAFSFLEIGPYFKKAEGNEQFKNHFHNDSGPLNVAKIRNNNPFVSMFIEAGTQHYRYTDDFNGEDQEGIGRYQVTQKMVAAGLLLQLI